MARRKPNTQPLWRFLFLIYALLMLWLLFGRNSRWNQEMSYGQMIAGNINLKPFYTIRNYMNIVLHYPNAEIFPHCVINLVGNVILFVPAGWLLPRIFRAMRRFFPFLMTCLCSIALVETVQLLTLLGSFDVDDIILNLTGMVAGFLLWKCFAKK